MFRLVGVEHRSDRKAIGVESAVVRKGHSESSGPKNDDATYLVEAQRSYEMIAELRDAVSDTSNAQRPETGQILADLGGVQMKSVGEFEDETVDTPDDSRIVRQRR